MQFLTWPFGDTRAGGKPMKVGGCVEDIFHLSWTVSESKKDKGPGLKSTKSKLALSCLSH